MPAVRTISIRGLDAAEGVRTGIRQLSGRGSFVGRALTLAAGAVLAAVALLVIVPALLLGVVVLAAVLGVAMLRGRMRRLRGPGGALDGRRNVRVRVGSRGG